MARRFLAHEALVLVWVIVSGSSPGHAVPATHGTIGGVVTDRETNEPIPYAQVAPDDAPARSVLTDERGVFLVRDVSLGSHDIVIRHVAYGETTRLVVLTPGRPSVELRIELSPSARTLDPVSVEATRVRTLTSDRRAAYTLPRVVIDELPIDDIAELVRLLPGVVVSGDRPFFRGLGFEHVVPVLDGVPLVEPLFGEWILPPPDAIDASELVAGPFDADLPPALGGVLQVRLGEGGPTPRGRLSYDSDRFDAFSSDPTRTDAAELSASGPTGIDGLYVAASWRGRLSDTYTAYDHARPSHEALGLVDLGERMHGDQSASLRLTLLPDDGEVSTVAPWKLALTLLHAQTREKPYHGNYDRSGWVGYEARYSRYTTFLADTAGVDSVLWYDGPAHVPTAERLSTLLIGSYQSRLGGGALNVHARLGVHDRETRPRSGPLTTVDDVRRWIRTRVTDEDDQTEWFYATHGDYPAFVDASAVEVGAGLGVTVPIGVHRFALGAGGTYAAHRYVGTVRVPATGELAAAGSFTDDVRSVDGYVYAQDVVSPDPFASLQIGARLDVRHIDGYLGRATAAAFSPRLGFRQPMTDVDALHVQVGSFHQFPGYQTYFPPAILADRSSVGVIAQRARAFEIGIQHHASRSVVVYGTFYVRAHDRVIFVIREPSELDFLFGNPTLVEPKALVSRGIELTVDHQLHPALRGQISATVGKATIEDRETPWSRTATARAWLSYRPIDTLRLMLFSTWDTGRPYSVCIKPRGDCLESELHEGRLPHHFSVDLGVRWALGRAHHVRLFAEARNVFDRRTPDFDFGVTNANVGVDNFVAYYDESGEPGGYLVDADTDVHGFDIDNPSTRSPGRNVRIGLAISL